MKLTTRTAAELAEADTLLAYLCGTSEPGSGRHLVFEAHTDALDWFRRRPGSVLAEELDKAREHLRTCPACRARFSPSSPGPAACSPTPSGAGTYPCC